MKRLFFVITLVGVAAIAGAAVPLKFTVQGILRDDAGKLQSMPVDVTARLYDASVGGNLVAGPYGPTTAMAVNGLFSVAFTDPALKDRLNIAAELWLEVSAGSETFSRQLVTSQLFAVVAAHALDADHAMSADALSGLCSGCVTAAHVAPGSLTRAHLAADALTHNHPATLTKTADFIHPNFLSSNGNVRLCSPACIGPALVVSGTCTQGNYRTKITAVEVDTVNQKYCCTFFNDTGATIPQNQLTVSAMCLAIGDTPLP